MSLAISAPRLVADEHNGTGPWWVGVRRLSDTHALGKAGLRMLATEDSGYSWYTIAGWENETDKFKGVYEADGASFHNAGEDAEYKWASPSGGNANVTGVTAPATARFYLDAAGKFARAVDRPFSVSGVPHLSNLRMGGGRALRLRDGSLLATSIATGVGLSHWGYLSVFAMHSRDDGFSWYYTSVVASADEVPYAHEGPSENALGFLRNGSIICVMRVEGESGHHSPYISKVSDDGGWTWRHLRSLRQWPGATNAPGCVCPNLETINGSLVLAGGRPNPTSHDVLLWLNDAGDGEDWRPYSVSYWHNRLVANKSWIMPTYNINISRRLPRYTTSYTSLVRTGNDSGFILYGAGIRAFALPFRVLSAA